MSTKDTLNFISRQLHIYCGLSILILGVIGGIFNFIIFTTLKTFRETTCAFYLAIVSIVNIGQLLTALFVRVLSEGFNTDIRSISWVCKVQITMAGWCNAVSFTELCLTTIDQYVSMSKYRHFSNLRSAQRNILLTCIFWSIYCICFLIYWDTTFGTCTVINSNFAIYVTRFQYPILFGFLPLSTMITFSLLAFYSARTLVSRQVNIVRLSRDRQLTAMTLVHVLFVVITTLPHVIYFTYLLNQISKDPEQVARNNLIFSITVLIDYSSYTGSFYIYCCVSQRFRKQFVYVLDKVFMTQCRQWVNERNNNNQIAPTITAILDVQPARTQRNSIEIVSIK
ncbi:unnamed protein product [Rotaria sp. Silwood1]|nr:unnamed protein product [Rotaria sp. Silwood1]CAF1574403.1 unnamed protein product [Rotaria sp. Silwood1]CAF3632721.1 unnamed protein product [Rotaria sp. Silwood1]CAF3742515.1 unnamed protein product [Rotaria sp. Silwood1]CAF4645753.1 unnamed protein product [Rotaria sp. Silwood1]